MPDIRVLHPDGRYHTYTGVESVTFKNAELDGERVKFYAFENPITILVDGVEYALENASEPTETDDKETYTVNIT